MNKFLLFLFVAILTIGCKKEDSEEEAPKQDYIDSVINTVGTDTTAFEYTSQNQLSKIIYDKDTWTKLEYYPDGNLAIINSYYVFPLSHDIKIREYLVLTYDNTMKLKSGILKRYVNNINSDITNIEYTLNDKDQVIEYTTNNPEVPGETISYDTNGNVATIEGADFLQTYTYNDKKSFLFNAALKYYIGATFVPVDIFNRNDIVKCDNSWNGTQETEDYTTEYNSEGLPLSSKILMSNSGSGIPETRNYKYKSR